MVRGLDPLSGGKLERKSHQNLVALENIAKDDEWATRSREQWQKAYVVVCFHQKERVVRSDEGLDRAVSARKKGKEMNGPYEDNGLKTFHHSSHPEQRQRPEPAEVPRVKKKIDKFRNETHTRLQTLWSADSFCLRQPRRAHSKIQGVKRPSNVETETCRTQRPRALAIGMKGRKIG